MRFLLMKKLFKPAISALCISALFSTAVFAEALVTDRPDQSESTNIVQPGYIQIEAGLLITGLSDDNTITEIPGTLLRIGLIEKLELRIGIDGMIMNKDADTSEFGDSELGAKYFLCAEDGWIPESAILGSISIPTADGNEDLGYGLRYAGGYTLSDKYSVGTNLETNWTQGINSDGDDALNLGLFYSAVLGVGLSDELGCFIEYFGESPVGAGGTPENLIDGGFTYLLSDMFQLDAYAAVGVSEAAPDWMFGAGFSYLLGF